MLQDFKENHVKVVNLKPADLVGASVKHLLNDHTGEETWWNAEVVNIDLSSKNQKNLFLLSFIIPMKKNMKLQFVKLLKAISLK